jgi:hypothetical protein
MSYGPLPGNPPRRVHLGDGVYARVGATGDIVLTSDDGRWSVTMTREAYSGLVHLVSKAILAKERP